MIKYNDISELAWEYRYKSAIKPTVKALTEKYLVYTYQNSMGRLYETNYEANDYLSDKHKKEFILDLCEIVKNDTSDEFFNFFNSLDIGNMSARNLFYRVLDHYNILKIAYRLGFHYKPVTEEQITENKINRYKDILNESASYSAKRIRKLGMGHTLNGHQK